MRKMIKLLLAATVALAAGQVRRVLKQDAETDTWLRSSMTSDQTAADIRFAEIVHGFNRDRCLSCTAGVQAPHDFREMAE